MTASKASYALTKMDVQKTRNKAAISGQETSLPNRLQDVGGIPIGVSRCVAAINIQSGN